MKTIAYSLILILYLASTFAARAQRQTLTVNPDSSSVAFALTGTGHEVHGSFHVQKGVITFDRTARSMSGEIVVSAASGDSGDKSRDKKMHSDVLDIEHYADVTFTPQKYDGTIAPSGDSNIQVSGTFTLHGTPHDITVPMQVHIDGANLTGRGSFVVPYVKWGLKDPSVFVLKVAKDVKIDLTLAGTVSSAQ
jgi:polyisoprenoid-binding protein YceI